MGLWHRAQTFPHNNRGIGGNPVIPWSPTGSVGNITARPIQCIEGFGHNAIGNLAEQHYGQYSYYMPETESWTQ
jgi:hypothetical protein